MLSHCSAGYLKLINVQTILHRWQGHATEWYTYCIVSGETAAQPLFSVDRYEIRHTSLIGHLQKPVQPYDKGMWNSSWMNSRGPSLLVVPSSVRTPTEKKIRGNTHRRTSETWRGRRESPPPPTLAGWEEDTHLVEQMRALPKERRQTAHISWNYSDAPCGKMNS
jgi:hypothetical protein